MTEIFNEMINEYIGRHKETLELLGIPGFLEESKEGLKEVKALTGGLKGFYRLRAGEYRIVFSMLKESKTIAVVNLAPRGNVY